MKTENVLKKLLVATVVIVLAMIIKACGGGGGAPAPAVKKGHGRVGAVVTFPARDASRAAGQSATGTITINVSISGYYSENDTAFTPVTAQVSMSSSSTQASVSVLDVPIGTNHLLTATAKYADGDSVTVKGLIAEVTEGERTSAYADSTTTVVAEAAIALAAQRGVTLSQISQSDIAQISSTVDAFIAAGYSPSEISTSDIIGYSETQYTPGSVVVSPASATVNIDGSQQFTATVKNTYGISISTSVTWSLSGSAGSIDQTGLFAASATGTAIVTAATGTVSGTATVAVDTGVTVACSADADCNDNDALTIDTCLNPGTANASCDNTPCTVACSADADCNDSDAYTLDTCTSPGTCDAACTNECISIACTIDTDCDDSNVMTTDTCLNAGLCNAACDNTYDTTMVPSVSSAISGAGTEVFMDLVLDDSAAKLFAVDYSAADIKVINISSASQTNTISYSPLTPISLAKDPARDAAYMFGVELGNYSGNLQIGKIDLSTETQVSWIQMGYSDYPMTGLVIAEARDEMYHAGRDYTNKGYALSIQVIDLGTFSLSATMPIVVSEYGYPGLAADDVNDHLYTASQSYSIGAYYYDLVQVDLNAATSTGVVGLNLADDMIFDISVHKHSGYPYMYSVQSSGLNVYSLSDFTQVCNYPMTNGSNTEQGGTSIGVFEPLHHVFLYDSSAQALEVIDATDCSLVTSLGNLPLTGFAFHEETGKVYLSGGGSSITVIQYAAP